MSEGKRLTYLTISLGVLVLLIAGYAFKDKAGEQWYLWKLESENEQERKLAAEKLGEMRSVRAIPRLVENFRREIEELPSTITQLSRTIEWEPANEKLRIPGPHGSYPKFPHSLATLVRIGEPAVPALVELVKDQVEKHSFFGLYALVKIGPPAIPTLSLALGDNIEYFRMQAAECLEVIAEVHGGPKTSAAVPSLRKALADESQDVRRSAAKALGKIGTSAGAAVPDLITRIEQDWDHNVRFYSTRSLGRIGPNATAAIPILKELEQSGDTQLKRAAAEALEKIQGEQAESSE